MTAQCHAESATARWQLEGAVADQLSRPAKRGRAEFLDAKNAHLNQQRNTRQMAIVWAGHRRAAGRRLVVGPTLKAANDTREAQALDKYTLIGSEASPQSVEHKAKSSAAGLIGLMLQTVGVVSGVISFAIAMRLISAISFGDIQSGLTLAILLAGFLSLSIASVRVTIAAKRGRP